MPIYSTSATYYSFSVNFDAKWIIGKICASRIDLHWVNILGFFSKLALVEFCINLEPGVDRGMKGQR